MFGNALLLGSLIKIKSGVKAGEKCKGNVPRLMGRFKHSHLLVCMRGDLKLSLLDFLTEEFHLFLHRALLF